MTGVVKHLPGKWKALSSNSSTTKILITTTTTTQGTSCTTQLKVLAQSWWLTPVSLATWKAEIGRISV
jgi:hypothetical protein